VIVVTFALNLVVAGSKIAYGYWSGALAIRADGFHSLVDTLNNVVGIVAIALASRPADANHPYGHQKFEVVAAGLLGVSLLAISWDIASGAFERLAGKSLPQLELRGDVFLLLLGTLSVNVFVAWWELRRGKALDSVFLQSDAVHTRSDILVTLGVLASVVLIRRGWPVFDLVAALGVAGYIAWTGISVLRQNLGYLTDIALVDPSRIEALVLEVPGVASTHKIRTRGLPGRVYVDLHIQIAPHLDVVQAHRVTHAVIDAIKRGVRGVGDVVVHTEPARPDQHFKPLPSDEPG
jgi:cation diffusion facilitator family transporter